MWRGDIQFLHEAIAIRLPCPVNDEPAGQAYNNFHVEFNDDYSGIISEADGLTRSPSLIKQVNNIFSVLSYKAC